MGAAAPGDARGHLTTAVGAVREGCLLLADISGYTRYLSGVELEHSRDVIADLLGVVTEELNAVGPLAKVEGDAVFVAGREQATDGDALLTALDAAYRAFAVRRRTVMLRTTCECDACASVDSLDLKLIAHHGEFAEHLVAGSSELVGPDVIVVHRLLKNRVTAATGIGPFALLTDACVSAGALDAAALGLIAHEESFEDVGRVRVWVRDLGERWRAAEQNDPLEVSAREADLVVSRRCRAPRGRVWDAVTSPEQIVLWKEGATAVEMRSPDGGRGVGTTIHCVHGRQAFDQEVLDWRPFDYFTYREAGPFGPFMWTIALRDEHGATEVEIRTRRLGGRGQALLTRLGRRRIAASLHRSLERLAALVEDPAALQQG